MGRRLVTVCFVVGIGVSALIATIALTFSIYGSPKFSLAGTIVLIVALIATVASIWGFVASLRAPSRNERDEDR